MSERCLRLVPMHVGQCALGAHHLLGDPYSDHQRVEFTLYSFLVDGGPGRRILVDLGPVGLPYINWMFHRYNFFRDLPGRPMMCASRTATCSIGSTGWDGRPNPSITSF